jgi:hypothetical protein
MRGAVMLLAILSSSLIAAEPIHWSLRPLKEVPIPETKGNPLDAFLEVQRRSRQLTASPEADRRTLVRRLYFDLLGLPPTPEQVREFVQDSSPEAYSKLVDRLLTAPHYGERWARHWMDVVHFGETHGHDQDRIRPNAWRYRDYLIESFNRDVPYSRFVREQVAADVLYPQEPQLKPALGFLASGPWDESSLRDIRDDSIDRQVGYYLDRDDMVTTVMSTFTSLTVHCARCHDHKFDPISQKDYYRLQAVFAGIGRGDVRYDADPKVARQRRELQDRLASITQKKPTLLAELRSEPFRKELATWEASFPSQRWQISEVVEAKSSHGSTLTRLPDGSLRAEGTRPDIDTYSLTLKSRLKGITAWRLELLADETLPQHGPGRQDNGNLHLSEFLVLHNGQRLPLGTPSSDYDQPAWTIQHTVDGNDKTAWGIYPEVGKSHFGIYPLKTPVGNGSETTYTVELPQLHGGGHLIGRFRLSATIAPVTANLASGPALLDVPPAQRNEAQWQELGLHFLREKTTQALAQLPPQQLTYAAAPDFLADASHKPVAMARPVHLLKRGEIQRKGDEVVPGPLSCLESLPANFDLPPGHREGARRAALAEWLSDSRNQLVWRSIVNRVWHYHFGRGLVDTPNDFGKMGGTPTHPELLDWLAIWFRDEAKGSIKQLHRLIVSSAAYRQSSATHADYAKVDADNRYLWRMPRTRLDVEQVRDAILLVSQRWDKTMGGPSDQQFAQKPGIHVTPLVEYGKFNWDRPNGHRRSVYRFVFRTLPDPFVDCLDGADASQWTPARNLSITAPQSLALFNNEFVLVHAQAWAKGLEKQAPKHEEQLRLASQQLWNREPTAEEVRLWTAHVEKHGLANLCRLLFNSNEFLFLD